MITKIDHIGIIVHDTDDAMQKYDQAFNLKTINVDINKKFTDFEAIINPTYFTGKQA